MSNHSVPRFAKRHYEAIAEAMQETKPPCRDASGVMTWEAIRNQLITTFRADSAAFKPDRFALACEPGSNVRARS